MTAIVDILRQDVALITLTFLIFWGASYLHRRTGYAVLNPMIVTIACLIVFLKVSGISYEEYSHSGHMIEFWLKPAIVALALPLYNQLRNIRRQFLPLLLTEVVGCVTGIVSVALIARWCGASREIVLSLVPKSVSTPIAIEISRELGGIPALTSAIVILVGMFGAVMGLKMMDIGGVTSPVSKSLSMGTAAHAMGTNKMNEYGDRYGAYATLGLIINGILTAFFAGPLVELVI